MTAVATESIFETATRVEKNRGVEYHWIVGEHDGGEFHAVLGIRHNKAGMNYFSGERTMEDSFGVALNTETHKDERGFHVTSFTMFAGLGLFRIPAGNRYSAKKLREAEAEAVERFKKLYASGDERILRYFSGEHIER